VNQGRIHLAKIIEKWVLVDRRSKKKNNKKNRKKEPKWGPRPIVENAKKGERATEGVGSPQ